MLNKIKSLLIIIFALFLFNSFLAAQNIDKTCFEVKYLDFFGLDEVGDIKWSDEQINELLKINYEKEFMNTRFYIPILVHFLKDFHPACHTSIDKERFNKLLSLYFKVTLNEVNKLENKSIEEKLNYVRDDFYRLVQIDDLLPLMKFTFDDGPLYGEIPKTIPKTNSGKSVATNFGKITIVKSKDKVFLMAIDKEGKIIWSRIMTGVNPKSYLQDLTFTQNSVQETSLATIIHLTTGERLTLYLKPDGKFMYYYHSW